MSEAPNEVAPAPMAPPPPGAPGPGASRYEWRAYRRETRRYWRGRLPGGYGPTGWGLFLASALIVVGIYYLLRNTGVLAWFPENVFWPILVIAWGCWLLVRPGSRARSA